MPGQPRRSAQTSRLCPASCCKASSAGSRGPGGGRGLRTSAPPGLWLASWVTRCSLRRRTCVLGSPQRASRRAGRCWPGEPVSAAAGRPVGAFGEQRRCCSPRAPIGLCASLISYGEGADSEVTALPRPQRPVRTHPRGDEASLGQTGEPPVPERPVRSSRGPAPAAPRLRSPGPAPSGHRSASAGGGRRRTSGPPVCAAAGGARRPAAAAAVTGRERRGWGPWRLRSRAEPRRPRPRCY